MDLQKIKDYITAAWIAFIAIGALLAFIQLYYNLGVRKLEKESQLKSLKAVFEAEEKQKKRIAQNLHDQVITLLSVAGQQIQDYLFAYNEKNLPENLKKAADLINQGISDIREVTLEFFPKTFTDFGLIKAIELYISQLNTAGQSETELVDKTRFKNKIPLPESDQLNIYRICLELLNNLQKHADYTFLRITVEHLNKHLVFKFEHDGKGVTNEKIEAFRKSSKGLGLDTLKTRLEIINAKINYLDDVIKLSISIQQ